jgi:hypothetical protein
MRVVVEALEDALPEASSCVEVGSSPCSSKYATSR